MINVLKSIKMNSEDLEIIDEMLSLSPPDDRGSFIHLIEWFIGYIQ